MQPGPRLSMYLYGGSGSDLCQTPVMLVMREWYMKPGCQLPSYEWNFSDVNLCAGMGSYAVL